MTRSFLALACAGAMMIAVGGQALAHAHLKASVPAADAVVSAPAQLKLTFNETLNLKFSKIRLLGPGKKDVVTGAASLADADKSIVLPVSAEMAPGTYTVDWNVLSVDGHKVKGTFSFTVKP